jgi:hypothetical protein
MMGRLFWLTPVLAAALLAGGCGSSSGKVSGTVTYQNQPLDSGTVTFYVVGSVPVTATITGGNYGPVNVPLGDAVIAVIGPPAVESPASQRGGKPQPGVRPAVNPSVVTLPVKYADGSTSDLHFTVGPGDNTYPIDLK